MPREDKSQTSIRAGSGESQIKAPAEVVTSGRLYVQPPYMRVQKAKVAGNLKMADAVQSLGKSVMTVIDDRNKRQEKRDTSDGMQAGLLGPTNDQEHYNASVAGQSQAFIDGYGSQAGRKTGYQITSEIKQELANGAFNSDADVDALISGHIKTGLEGMDEEEAYKANVLDVVGKAEAGLRETWRTQKNESALETITLDFNAAERNDFSQQALDGATVAEMHATYRTYQDQANIMGLTNQKAGELAIANIEEAAIRSGRPELFDMFEMSNQPTDNPELTLPGIANSPKMKAKIDDAKKRVLSSIKADTEKRGSKAEYQALRTHEDKVNAGGHEEALLDLPEMVDAKIYTPKQAVAEERRIMKLKEKQDKVNGGVALISGGQAFLSAGLGYSDKDMEDSMALYGANLYSDAKPEELGAVHAIVIGKGIENGIMLPQHKAMFRDVSPMDADKWTTAAEMYLRYTKESPDFLMQNISDKNSAAFDRYAALVERGMPPESARLSLGTMGEPDVMERYLKTEKDYFEKTITNELASNIDQEWNPIDGAVGNGFYVEDRVKESALLYMALHNTDNAKEAIDHASKMFSKNHSAMQDEDGKYIYTFHGGVPLPGNFSQVTTSLSEEYVKYFKDSKLNKSDYYTLAPNPHDPTGDDWILSKADGSPVSVLHETGYSSPKYINRKELVAEYEKNQEQSKQPKVMSKREHAYWMRNKRVLAEERAAMLEERSKFGRQDTRMHVPKP